MQNQIGRVGRMVLAALAAGVLALGAQQAYAATRPAVFLCSYPGDPYACFEPNGGELTCIQCCQLANHDTGECVQPTNTCLCRDN